MNELKLQENFSKVCLNNRYKITKKINLELIIKMNIVYLFTRDKKIFL